MIGFIEALIFVFPVILLVSIFLGLIISFVVLVGIKTAHTIEKRSIMNVQGRHIWR